MRYLRVDQKPWTLTDIAPHWRHITDVSCPNEGVDKVGKADERYAREADEQGDVARSELGRKGYED
jgi:hypothetical protein